jgi:hypothetical protein
MNRRGYSIYPNQGSPARQVGRRLEMSGTNVSHWKNFQESIRLRRKPASDIENFVRSTVTCLLANIAMRYGAALDWDDRTFTVQQTEAQPLLKPRYRAPWKLEV